MQKIDYRLDIYWNPLIHKESLSPEQAKQAVIQPGLSYLHGHLFKTPDDVAIAPAMRNGTYEYYELCHIKKILQPDDVFIDVGACVGVYSVVASHAVGAKGIVVSIEPHDITYLHWNLLNNKCHNCVIYNLAACNKEGQTYLEVDETNFGNHSRSDKQTNKTVPSTTIDKIINSGGQVKMIKIDTQGDELNVILGAMRTIQNSPNISLLVELSPKHLKEKGQDFMQFLNLIYDTLKFNVYFFAPDSVHDIKGGGTTVNFSHGYRLMRISKDELIKVTNWELNSNPDFFMNLWCAKV